MVLSQTAAKASQIFSTRDLEAVKVPVSEFALKPIQVTAIVINAADDPSVWFDYLVSQQGAGE